MAAAAVLIALWIGSAGLAGATVAAALPVSEPRAAAQAYADCHAVKTGCARLCAGSAIASELWFSVPPPPFGLAAAGAVRAARYSLPRRAAPMPREPVLPRTFPHRLRLRL